jgi:hypothetical protein
LQEIKVFNSYVVIRNKFKKPEGGVVHICNSSIKEAEAGRSQVRGQPWLHNKTQPRKKRERGQRGNGKGGRKERGIGREQERKNREGKRRYQKM